MTFTKKILGLAVLAGFASMAHAVTATVPTSFNGLTWTFASNVSGQTDCTQLVLDATGDLNQGFGLGLHGFLNCTSGSYAVSGTAYFTVTGQLNMTMHVGAGTIAVCNALPSATLSGPCSIFNGSGATLGAGSIAIVR
jgi:hypothetical protein